ncbi:MAG: hypothetical protein ACFFCS_01520 [Candidatus Hodarchaeota archaeon]
MVDARNLIRQLRGIVHSGNLMEHLSGELGKHFEVSVDRDWDKLGLKKHFILSRVSSHYNDRKGDMVFPGLLNLWSSLFYYIGEYAMGEIQSHVGKFKYRIGQNHVKWFIDFQVEDTYHLVNDESLVTFDNIMDWDLWGLRAEYLLKKDSVSSDLWRPVESGSVWYRPVGFVENEHFIVFFNISPEDEKKIKILQLMFPITTMYRCTYAVYTGKHARYGIGLILHNFLPSNNHPLFLSTLTDVILERMKLGLHRHAILSPSKLKRARFYDGYLRDVIDSRLKLKEHYEMIRDKLLEWNGDLNG